MWTSMLVWGMLSHQTSGNAYLQKVQITAKMQQEITWVRVRVLVCALGFRVEGLRLRALGSGESYRLSGSGSRI